MTGTVTIPANATTVFNTGTRCTVFFCITAVSAFTVRPNYGAAVSIGAGQGFGSPAPAGLASAFNLLTFTNPTASALDVTFYYGTDAWAQSGAVTAGTVSVSTRNPVTDWYSFVGTTALAAGNSSAAFNATGQKQILVSNLDAANALQITTTDGVVLATVFPGTTFTVEITAAFKVKNPSGSAVNYQASAIVYV